MTAMAKPRQNPVVFSPTMCAEDAEANHWMRQATLRLRRETSWRWHQANKGHGSTDRLLESLDLTRYADEKQTFFASNVTARYLTDEMEGMPPPAQRGQRGGFAWAAEELALDEAARFALGLALLAGFDSAAGPVIAGCLADATKTLPTLALLGRLWDRLDEALVLADPAHPLWRLGLLHQVISAASASAAIDWDTPFACPPLVARRLASPGTPLPNVLRAFEPGMEVEGFAADDVAARMRDPAEHLRIMPLRGKVGAAYGEAAHAIAVALGREMRRADTDGSGTTAEQEGRLRSLLTVAWLAGVDLFIEGVRLPDGHQAASPFAALAAIPATVYMPIADAAELKGIPHSALLPIVDIPALTHEARVRCWQHHLGRGTRDIGTSAIGEIARRFRYEPQTIAEICKALGGTSGRVTIETVAAMARAQVPLETGDLAQTVAPRFTDAELVLPPAQRRQFEEIYQAMRWLTEVHYGWGTARAWNEGGISVLFTGQPGTGKTMAAEVLAVRLAMPMYRIDLSQVVNKYIGETEKNLKRLFDMADVADAILFFDEAGALFSRRTEVHDAHAHYANLEISYLLERMERFRGLAILATNRRKDLDEAFLRRLRYIIEFPLPDVTQRRAIWERMIPSAVDARALDLDFLARQFQLAGGNIRSIVLNACLQTAGLVAEGDGVRRLSMPQVLIAVKRECEKLGRTVSPEQFDPYTTKIEELRDE